MGNVVKAILATLQNFISFFSISNFINVTFCSNITVIMSQAKDIMSDYQTGVLENSAKMVLLFHMIDESVKRRDKILIFRYKLFPVSTTVNPDPLLIS